jgi:hypothetical protein
MPVFGLMAMSPNVFVFKPVPGLGRFMPLMAKVSMLLIDGTAEVPVPV